MGQTESSSQAVAHEPYYVAATGSSPNGEIDIQPSTSNLIVAKKLVRNEVSGIWSMHGANSITPEPRSSHFTVNFPENDVTVIGYGVSKNNQLLNDVWFVNHKTRSWSKFDVDTSEILPRSGTAACVIGDNIWLFGGFRQSKYMQDLHVINVRTKKVYFPKTTGPMPAPRVGHIMVSYGKSIYIWGGFNGDWLTHFSILNTETMEWREIQTDIRGRVACSASICKDALYIFGSTRTEGLLKFDFQTEKLTTVKTIGQEPNPELASSSMVTFDNFLLVVGGKAGERPFQLLYCFDVDMRWWFVLPVIPDGLTVNLSDGSFTKNGFFLTPTVVSASAIYRSAAREVTVFLGQPFINPPNFFCVDLANSLGYFNLQKDLLQQLRFN